ncbi:MAG: hypothetical protein ABI809_01090 [Caldimonas sp.]
MTERIFSAALTFMLLAGGTAAIGSAMFGLDRPAPRHAVEASAVALPTVEVTGRRPAAVIAARSDVEVGAKPTRQ